MSDVEDLERMRKFGAYQEQQRIIRLMSDQLVTPMLNQINPVVDYNKFIQLMISLVKTE